MKIDIRAVKSGCVKIADWNYWSRKKYLKNDSTGERKNEILMVYTR